MPELQSKFQRIITKELGRDMICQFVEFFTLGLLAQMESHPSRPLVETIRTNIIFLRMAMRFGKPSQMLGEI